MIPEISYYTMMSVVDFLRQESVKVFGYEPTRSQRGINWELSGFALRIGVANEDHPVMSPPATGLAAMLVVNENRFSAQVVFASASQLSPAAKEACEMLKHAMMYDRLVYDLLFCRLLEAIYQVEEDTLK